MPKPSYIQLKILSSRPVRRSDGPSTDRPTEGGAGSFRGRRSFVVNYVQEVARPTHFLCPTLRRSKDTLVNVPVVGAIERPGGRNPIRLLRLDVVF